MVSTIHVSNGAITTKKHINRGYGKIDKIGDNVLLYRGDCLEEMSKIPDGSVDLVLTDPPYGTTACKWDSVIPFEPMWAQLHRVAKKSAAIVLFGSEPFSSALRMSNIKRFKYDWVWDKVRPSGFQLARIMPMKRHELVSVFCAGSVPYFPQKEMREKPVKGRVASKSESSPLKYSDGITRTYTEKNPQSIIVYYKGADGAYIHPTQKPVALLEYLIRTYTQPGETVLDFTMGSGSTGVACVNTNRNFIGIELDEKYYDISKKRIEETLNAVRE